MRRETIYYAEEWMDEIPGVSGNLTTVASVLANGDECLAVKPQPIPSEHRGEAIAYAWVPVPKDGDTYMIPDDLPGAPHAIAYAQHLGWSPEMIVYDREDAAEKLREVGVQPVEYLVCQVSYQQGILHLEDGPRVTFEPAGDDEKEGV